MCNKFSVPPLCEQYKCLTSLFPQEVMQCSCCSMWSFVKQFTLLWLRAKIKWWKVSTCACLFVSSALSSSNKLARSFHQFVPVVLLLVFLIESVVYAEQRMWRVTAVGCRLTYRLWVCFERLSGFGWFRRRQTRCCSSIHVRGRGQGHGGKCTGGGWRRRLILF